MDFRIGNVEIGHGKPVFIIAEACDNHMGDISVAKEMALQSKLAGANAVKYQHHLPYEEMLKDIPKSDNFQEPLYDFLLKYALKLEDHIELKRYCEEIGIIYMCTPFSAKAAEDLAGIGLEVFKIGSGEMTDHASLKRMAKLGKPMILSTGMCEFDEIKETYDVMKGTGVPFALMNCTSEYPPVYEDINLGFIGVLRKHMPDVAIGHSDHTPDLYTCFAAVASGACIIEKHIILNKTTPGPDQSVSIDMIELHQLCDGIRKVEKALGSTKKVHGREKQIREWAFRSVVTTQPIKAGTVITEAMLWTKRPGTGIPSRDLPKLVGKKAKVDLAGNILLKWDDLE